MAKKMVNPELTELLHKAFSCYPIHKKFINPELYHAAFGHLKISSSSKEKEAKKVCKNFISARREGGEIKSTDEYADNPYTTRKQTYVVYEKVSHAKINQIVPIKIIPNVYYKLREIWNRMPSEKWVTVAEFRDQYAHGIASDVISKFLNEAAKHGTVLSKELSGKNRYSYKRLLQLDLSVMMNNFTIFRTKPVGERINEEIDKSTDVPADTPSEDISQKSVDPNNMTYRQFYESIIETAIADKKRIEKLTGQQEELINVQTSMKNRVKDLEREVDSLRERLKAAEATIKLKDDDIILLRRALKNEKQKRESETKVKLPDIIDLTGGKQPLLQQ